MNSFLFPPKIRFLLVRSGSTDLDDQGRILGSLDLPLSKSGELEIQNTAAELQGLEITAIYSSAAEAARQSARRLAENCKCKVRTEEKLTNLDCGLWHGKSLFELRETQPTLFKQWQDNPESVRPPQGERVETVRARVTAFLKKIRRKHKSGTIVIVAPDPLLHIIRCEIESRPLLGRTTNPTRCAKWELVEQLEPVH